MVPMTAAAIERKLGSASGRLYAEVGELVELASRAGASAQQTRVALARIALGVLCGEYHDYRAGAPDPKGDFVQALRQVPLHRSVDAEISALIEDVQRGEYADGDVEAAKYVARVAPPARHLRVVEPLPEPEPIDLTQREWRVFVWLYRHVEVYGFSPLVKDMAIGLEMASIEVSNMLQRLERKGAVARIGGIRGWIPVRAP